MSSKSNPPGPTSPSPASLLTQSEQDRQYFRRVLEDLVDIGAELAQMILAEAKVVQADPGASAAPREDFTVSLDRIARSMRLSKKLADSLQDPVEDAGNDLPAALPDNVIPFRRK